MDPTVKPPGHSIHHAMCIGIKEGAKHPADRIRSSVVVQIHIMINVWNAVNDGPVINRKQANGDIKRIGKMGKTISLSVSIRIFQDRKDRKSTRLNSSH